MIRTNIIETGHHYLRQWPQLSAKPLTCKITDLLSNGHLTTKFNQIWIKIQYFYSWKCVHICCLSNGGYFAKDSWAHWNLMNNLLWFWFFWSNQVTILHMPWQLGCHGMCKSVTWLGHCLSLKSLGIFGCKIWIMSSQTFCGMDDRSQCIDVTLEVHTVLNY